MGTGGTRMGEGAAIAGPQRRAQTISWVAWARYAVADEWCLRRGRRSTGASAHLVEQAFHGDVHLLRRVVGAGGDLAADQVDKVGADAACVGCLRGRVGGGR